MINNKEITEPRSKGRQAAVATRLGGSNCARYAYAAAEYDTPEISRLSERRHRHWEVVGEGKRAIADTDVRRLRKQETELRGKLRVAELAV